MTQVVYFLIEDKELPILHSSAAAKRSPGHQMQPTKQSDNPDIPNHWPNRWPNHFCCQSSIIPDDADMLDM